MVYWSLPQKWAYNAPVPSVNTLSPLHASFKGQFLSNARDARFTVRKPTKFGTTRGFKMLYKNYLAFTSLINTVVM